MRVLIVSSFFPPDAMGGAEISAWNFGQWLRRHGHEVAVLTTARRPQDACDDVLEDGLRIWRIATPRLYPVHEYGSPPNWARLVWHLQDHLDPRNQIPVRRVLDAFAPDAASIHLLTGIGWNTLVQFADRDVPVMFGLHDAALACLRSGMFRAGRTCTVQCRECRLSSAWKQHQVGKLRRVGFYSPSAANLARVEQFVPLANHPRLVMVNPNRYPAARVAHMASPHPRLLYVGRLHPMKGVAVLLEAAERVAATCTFTLDLVGGGPEHDALLARYGHHRWLTFHGHVDQPTVSDHMARADLLCAPSVWEENAPGVVIHALGIGLPVLASAIGGLPELVRDGITGKLVPPGNSAAWAQELTRLITDPQILPKLRANAWADRARFDPELAGQALCEFLGKIAGGSLTPRPPPP